MAAAIVGRVCPYCGSAALTDAGERRPGQVRVTCDTCGCKAVFKAGKTYPVDDQASDDPAPVSRVPD